MLQQSEHLSNCNARSQLHSFAKLLKLIAIQSHRTASKVNCSSLKVKCYLTGFLQQMPILELYQLCELLKTSVNNAVDIEVNLVS